MAGRTIREIVKAMEKEAGRDFNFAWFTDLGKAIDKLESSLTAAQERIKAFEEMERKLKSFVEFVSKPKCPDYRYECRVRNMDCNECWQARARNLLDSFTPSKPGEGKGEK